MPGLDERVERFAEKITNHLVVIDPRDYPLNGIDDASAGLWRRAWFPPCWWTGWRPILNITPGTISIFAVITVSLITKFACGGLAGRRAILRGASQKIIAKTNRVKAVVESGFPSLSGKRTAMKNG